MRLAGARPSPIAWQRAPARAQPTQARALETPLPPTAAVPAKPHPPSPAASAGVAAALGTTGWAGVIDALARQMRAEGEERSDHVHYGGVAATEHLFAALGVAGDAHILDLCSGEGGPARHLARAHPSLRITCVDLDTGNIERARAINGELGFATRIDSLAATAEHMTAIADKTVDGIIGLDPDAFAYADHGRLCAELHRVLKPGGKLVFQHWALSPGAPPALSRAFDGFCAWGATVPRGVNADAYAQALRHAGFDVHVIDSSQRYAADHVRFVGNLLHDHGEVETAAHVEQLFARARQSGALPPELARLRDREPFTWAIGMLDFAARHGIGLEIHATKRR